MGRTFTRLKMVFFGLLLGGLIVIQYCWIQSLQKDKLKAFKYLIVSGIDQAASTIPFTGSLATLTDTTIANALRRSFFAKGLGHIPFEFNMGSGRYHIASHGFDQNMAGLSNHLTFYYIFPESKKQHTSKGLLTVVIPFWKSYAWKEMAWVIIASALLTIMILAIFCCATILGKPGQQLFYTQRRNAIQKMMQQLETPLSTVSVAAGALCHARVMRDAGKIKFYQQVINEENKRMNEEVERLLKELK